ncbi:putative minor capsid protein [Eel River basin pequenovirus]|nr:putative minor capsid protein [Eel River basin pequenovirus]
MIELDGILAFGPVAAAGAATGKSLLSGIGSKILGSAGSLLGGLFSSKSADKSWQRQLKFLEKQQSFTERMSNTSWQRGVADMKKAGINPLLAVSQGGASTPAGGGGTAPKSDSLSPMDFLGMKAMEAQIGLTNAQELTERERTDLVKNQRRSLEATAAFGDVIKEFGELLRDFRNTPTGEKLRDEISKLGNNNTSSAEGTHRNNRDGELIAPEFEAQPKKKITSRRW